MSDAIEAHLDETRRMPPPAEFAKHARIRDRSLHDEAEADPSGFWLRQALEQITWTKEPTESLDDANPPFYRWFKDGELNLTYNCLDRHVEAGGGDKVAYTWIGEPGEERVITYRELLADVEGVSAEDMRKFRAAAYKAQRDPKLKEIKAKRAQLLKEAEFLSQEEKKNMRGEFEQIQSDLRQANLAALAAAAPDLSKETLEKIYEAVETRTREAIEKAGKKKATKTPLKPFPFGEKK